jgi:hypothetical protein
VIIGGIISAFPFDYYVPNESIKVYWEEPQEPYKIIGKVSAKSDDLKEEKIFNVITPTIKQNHRCGCSGGFCISQCTP